MKRLILFALGATCCMGTQAQVVDDDFDNFIKTEVQSFDKFIDDANKQFIGFLRNPWKEFEAKKPVEKRTKPEPVKPVVYDEKKDPVAPPVELDIEDILGQSTGESKQRPQGKINDGEKVGFEKLQLPSLQLRQLSLLLQLSSLRLRQLSLRLRKLSLRLQFSSLSPLQLSLRLQQLSLLLQLPSLRLLQPSLQPLHPRPLRQQWCRCRPLSLLHLQAHSIKSRQRSR